MELVNELYSYPALGDNASQQATRAVVQLLCPIAPHITEELWENIGEKGLCCESTWPQADPKWLIAEEVEVVIQINGKVRSRIQVAPKTAKDVLEREAMNDPKIKDAIQGKTIAKVIVVPDKLVNVVVQ